MEISDDLKTHEPQRIALYKAIAALFRAYANLADDLEGAGYGTAEIARIKYQVDRYRKLRDVIRNASGETIDLKSYEADMRHLIDTYIEASEPRQISPFDNMPLLELIGKIGIDDAIARLPKGIKDNQTAVAETIENNVRSKIVQESLSDPAYYANMSALLDEIIAARRQKAIAYEDYLKKIAELAQQVENGQADGIPAQLQTQGQRALYNNLLAPISQPAAPAGTVAEASGAYSLAQQSETVALALQIDATIKRDRPDDWRGNPAKENQIKGLLYGILQDVDQVERIFLIIQQQPEYSSP